jgi:hypothetical protein
MTTDYPFDEAPATAAYVLEVLREFVQFEFPEDELTFDSSLVEVVNAFNDLTWTRTRVLSNIINSIFAAGIPLSEWEAAFPSLRRRTVRDLCEFLAPRISQPIIRPWAYISGDCLPAGAFLTIRSLMVHAGENPAGITPSAALGPHLLRLHSNRSLWKLVKNLTRVAPGRLPQIDVHYGALGKAGNGAVGLGCLGFFAGLVFVGIGVGGIGLALIGLSCVFFPLAFLFGFLSGLRPPRTVEFTGLTTFRDLAYCLAGQQPRPQIQPSA